MVGLSACRLFSSYEFAKDTAANTVTLEGVVSDFLTQAPLAAVEVCGFEQPDVGCTDSDADGRFTLSGFSPGEEICVSYARSTHMPSLSCEVVPAEAFDRAHQLIDTIQFNLLASVVSPPYAQEHAVIAVGAELSGTLATGVEVSMSPDSGHGPYFMTPEGPLDLSATASQGNFVVWHDMTDGFYTFTATHPTWDCRRSNNAWPSDDPNAMRLRAVAGFVITAPSFLCTLGSEE